MNAIQITPDVVDFGNNPEIFVSGIASIARISAGVVRESFFVEVASSDGGNKTERRLVLTVLWDAEQWFAARGMRATADVRHIPACPQQAAGYELRH
jgi:hypothetical protein